MDGKGALFATLCGDHKDVLHKISVELPPKHGKKIMTDTSCRFKQCINHLFFFVYHNVSSNFYFNFQNN